MKRIVLLLALISLFSVTARAQTITASEMIRHTICQSFDCYNSFIINKGFSFDKAFNESGNKSYRFLSDERLETSNPDITTKNCSTFGIYNDGIIDVGFGTSKKDQYQSLLDAFRNMEFTISNTQETNDGGMRVNYRSKLYPNILLTVLVEQVSNKDGESWVFYDFEVSSTAFFKTK